jgi:hypothetical protein
VLVHDFPLLIFTARTPLQQATKEIVEHLISSELQDEEGHNILGNETSGAYNISHLEEWEMKQEKYNLIAVFPNRRLNGDEDDTLALE